MFVTKRSRRFAITGLEQDSRQQAHLNIALSGSLTRSLLPGVEVLEVLEVFVSLLEVRGCVGFLKGTPLARTALVEEASLQTQSMSLIVGLSNPWKTLAIQEPRPLRLQPEPSLLRRLELDSASAPPSPSPGAVARDGRSNWLRLERGLAPAALIGRGDSGSLEARRVAGGSRADARLSPSTGRESCESEPADPSRHLGAGAWRHDKLVLTVFTGFELQNTLGSTDSSLEVRSRLRDSSGSAPSLDLPILELTCGSDVQTLSLSMMNVVLAQCSMSWPFTLWG
ncbi:hypothetical protein H920_13826 [Fukomys damarensis]|uniref:Uncharacterized protein n=1 Tax=Fukomys damarensis TaxID=885580 RepID=A0A091D3N9_FUKDA|nr:hypothetical protein H920_13826 [Fukomys damarensis]